MQGFTLCRERRYVHRAARATAHRCMSREAEKVEHSARPQRGGRIQRRHAHFHMRTGARAGAALADPSATSRRQ